MGDEEGFIPSRTAWERISSVVKIVENWPIPFAPKRKPAGGGQIEKRFRVKSVQANYLTCRTIDGDVGDEVEGDNDVLVAKPTVAQPDLWTGDSGDFSYGGYGDDGTTRTATNGAAETEDQIITPFYAPADGSWPGEIIMTKRADTGMVVSDVRLVWIETTPSRGWSEVEEEE